MTSNVSKIWVRFRKSGGFLEFFGPLLCSRGRYQRPSASWPCEDLPRKSVAVFFPERTKNTNIYFNTKLSFGFHPEPGDFHTQDVHTVSVPPKNHQGPLPTSFDVEDLWRFNLDKVAQRLRCVCLGRGFGEQFRQLEGVAEVWVVNIAEPETDSNFQTRK